MKLRVGCLFVFFLYYGQSVSAEIITSHIKFDTKIGLNECIERSKSARLELFDDDFGEDVLDDDYFYLNDDLSITVTCLKNKQIVIIYVATQGKNPVYYLRTFEKYIKGEARMLKEEPKPRKPNKKI